MLNVSPYIAQTLKQPKAQNYSSPLEVMSDRRLSLREKTRLLDEMERNLTGNDQEVRNGMYFDYSRIHALKEIKAARNNLHNSYAF